MRTQRSRPEGWGVGAVYLWTHPLGKSAKLRDAAPARGSRRVPGPGDASPVTCPGTPVPPTWGNARPCTRLPGGRVQPGRPAAPPAGQHSPHARLRQVWTPTALRTSASPAPAHSNGRGGAARGRGGGTARLGSLPPLATSLPAAPGG